MQLKRAGRHAATGSAAFAAILVVALPAAAQVAVRVNGNQVDFSPPPTIENGRVFVPLRGVFERLGASVTYSNGTIDATGNGRNISLHIGSTQATIDGQSRTIDVAPFIVGASTFVPLRFVSEALGAAVSWDDAQSLVSIDSNGARGQGYAGQANGNGIGNDGGYGDSSYGNANDGNYSSYAPPPLPEYRQPDVPEANAIWQPGYWAWGQNGYYWVPGTWVEAPQTNYLWTPGYWGSNNGGFSWNPGYWARAVGFYGGLNYGGGYNGNGYDGAQWSGNDVRYNTAYTQVNPGAPYGTYARSGSYANQRARTSYNGGPNGLSVRPTSEQMTVGRAHHVGMTAAQQQHVRTAAQDRRLLATVNHNEPPLLVVARPLSTSNLPAGLVPVTASDRVAPVAAAKAAVRAAPVIHAAPVVPNTPVHAAPPKAAVPVTHAAPVAHAAPVKAMAPVVRAVPAKTAAPVVRAAPVATAAPVVHSVPAKTAAPVVRTVPAKTAAPVVHAVPAKTAAPVVRAAPAAAAAKAVVPVAHPVPPKEAAPVPATPAIHAAAPKPTAAPVPPDKAP